MLDGGSWERGIVLGDNINQYRAVMLYPAVLANSCTAVYDMCSNAAHHWDTVLYAASSTHRALGQRPVVSSLLGTATL